jgi:hypothetical protein
MNPIGPFTSLEPTKVLEVLEKSADKHAEGSGEAYAVGDHLDSLRVALELMTAEQRRQFCAERADDVETWLE